MSTLQNASQREIGGVVYTCEKLPAEPAFKLFLRATKTLEAAEGLLEAVIFGGDDLDVLRNLFVFARECDEEKVHALVTELYRLPKGDGEPDGIADLLKLAQFALEVNYKDFLGGSLGQKLRGEAPTPPMQLS